MFLYRLQLKARQAPDKRHTNSAVYVINNSSLKSEKKFCNLGNYLSNLISTDDVDNKTPGVFI